MLHRLTRQQILLTDPDTAWEFISHPRNIQQITPPDMNFIVLSEMEDVKMYPGLIIEYIVSPFKGINTSWVTEITHVKDKEFFVDEQRFGPYKFWHHQHLIKPIDGGVEMTDIVHYKLPFGWFGLLANHLLVKRKLEHIFAFRMKKLNELFNEQPSPVNTNG